MKKQINEIKRMQQLAGILKESQLNENLEDKEQTISIENASTYFFNVDTPEEFDDYFYEFTDNIKNSYGRDFLTKDEFEELYLYLGDLEDWSSDDFEETWEEWKD
jgi:hypothetical protein